MAFATNGDRVEPPKQPSAPAGGIAKVSSATLAANKAFGTRSREPSLKRKRLHALYLVDDLLSHAHDQQPALLETLEPFILQLVTYTASCSSSQFPEHHKKLTSLFAIWETKAFPEQLILQFRHAHATAATDATPAAERTAIPAIEAPWIMPSQHGDLSIPWYDQPAGAFINAITPGDNAPLPTFHIQPVPLPSGPAPPDQIAAVRKLLQDVRNDHEGADTDPTNIAGFDSLGQTLLRDDATGDLKTRGDYYGWSEQFARFARAVRVGGPDVVQDQATGWLADHQPPPPPARPRSPPRRGGLGGWRGGGPRLNGPPAGYGNMPPPPVGVGMGSRGPFWTPRGPRGTY